MQQLSLWDTQGAQPQSRLLTYGDIFEVKFIPPDWMTPEEYAASLKRRGWQSTVEIFGYKKEHVHFDVRYLSTRTLDGLVIAICQLFDAGVEILGQRRDHSTLEEEEEEF